MTRYSEHTGDASRERCRSIDDADVLTSLRPVAS